MWGDGGWIFLILIFALFGWGGNGFGNNGNNGGGGVVPTLGGIATRSDIMDGFALNDLQRGVSGIQQGICDSTYFRMCLARLLLRLPATCWNIQLRKLRMFLSFAPKE